MKLFSYLFFFALFFSCSYVPEKIDVSYRPLQHYEKIPAASDVAVHVHVVDNRREGKSVGHKKGEHNIERASIKLSNNLSEEIKKAISLELYHRGFSLKEGTTEVQIEIQKFYNEFKEQLFGSRGVSELILHVTVTKQAGSIYYSKMIIGIGENESVWLHSGNNAQKALNAALKDALSKLFNDRSFLQALIKT